MAPIAQGADRRTALLFRYHPSVCGTLLVIAEFIYFLVVLGLRFLAPPAVTSAIEVLTQTFRHWSKKSHAPPARPRNDPVRSQASPEKRIILSDGSSRSVAAYHEAAGVRSLVLAMSHLELIASGPPSGPSLTRGLRVLRMFEHTRLFDGRFQQISTTAIVPFYSVLWQHSLQAFSG